MKVRLFEPGDAGDWQRYVNEHERATAFHQLGWKRVVEETYGHKPYYLLAEETDGRIRGVLPMFLVPDLRLRKRLISVPFAPYGGVCSDGEAARLYLIVEALRLAEALGARYCEFREMGEGPAGGDSRPTSHYVTDIVDLSPGMGPVWDVINKNVKRKINKGVKSGLTFHVKEGRQAVLGFYGLYARTMSRLGTPVHSASFFTNIAEQLPVYVADVEHDGTVVSSLFLMRHKDTMIYGWGASRPEYLKLSPNALNYWRSMEYAQGLGLKRFDFGRSLVGSGNRHFKEGWGAVEVPLTYCYYPSRNTVAPPQHQFGRLAPVWSKLPLALSRLVGPEIRRFVP